MPTLLQHNYVQIVLRCIAVYIFIVIAIRIFGKKELAQLSVIDLVFILLISNSVQNAMVGPDNSVAGGIIAACSLFLVNNVLKRLLYQHQPLSDLLQGESLMLIYRGQIQTANLAKARITREELDAAVREHGVETTDQVDLCMLEVDGNVSVISGNFHKQSNHTMPNIGVRKKRKWKGRIV